MIKFAMILEEIMEEERRQAEAEAAQKRLHERQLQSSSNVRSAENPPVTAVATAAPTVAPSNGINPAGIPVNSRENPVVSRNKTPHPYGRSCG